MQDIVLGNTYKYSKSYVSYFYIKNIAMMAFIAENCNATDGQCDDLKKIVVYVANSMLWNQL